MKRRLSSTHKTTAPRNQGARTVADLEGLQFTITVACSMKGGRFWKLPLRRWPDYRLLVVRGGHGWVECGNQKFELRRGGVLLGLPGEVYGASHDERNRIVISVIRFDAVTDRGKRAVLSSAFRPRLCITPRCFPLLEPLMMRLTNAVPRMPWLAQGLTDAMLRTILWMLHEDHHSGDNLQARHIAHEDLKPVFKYAAEPGKNEPGIESMARECGMSVSTFRRRMHCAYGKSPKQFMLYYRMERAKELLVQSQLTVEAIAAELDYSETSHFSRQFKQHEGISPAAFRTSNQ